MFKRRKPARPREWSLRLIDLKLIPIFGTVRSAGLNIYNLEISWQLTEVGGHDRRDDDGYVFVRFYRRRCRSWLDSWCGLGGLHIGNEVDQQADGENKNRQSQKNNRHGNC